MSPDYGSDDATPPPTGHVGGQYGTSDQFIGRTIDEGASPQAARPAAAAHFEPEEKRLQPGELLPGWTARRWEEAMFVMLGCFFAVLISVCFTAPAFHPGEPATEGKLSGVLVLATLLLIIVLMVSSRFAGVAKADKEMRLGYTTLRWLGGNSIEVRDSRGKVIPLGDKRLTTSAKNKHALILIGSACAVLSLAIWIFRLAIQ